MSYQPTNRTPLSSPSAPHIQRPYTLKPRTFGISFPEKSRFTRQEFKDESDINTIMRRYLRTGELPHVNTLAPQYFDASPIDFQGHMQVIAEAKSLFAQLPASIRSRFYNNPGQFVDFCSDPANRTELAHMGLLSPEATRSVLNPVPPTAPSVAAPTAAPAAPSAPVSAPVAPSGAA